MLHYRWWNPVPAWLLALLLHQPIQLTVRPQVCLAPCTIQVQVRIARHPDNRAWDLTVDSEGFTSASSRPLDGDQAPITQPMREFRDLPAGDYLVTARVIRVHLRAPEYHTASTHVTIA